MLKVHEISVVGQVCFAYIRRYNIYGHTHTVLYTVLGLPLLTISTINPTMNLSINHLIIVYKKHAKRKEDQA